MKPPKLVTLCLIISQIWLPAVSAASEPKISLAVVNVRDSRGDEGGEDIVRKIVGSLGRKTRLHVVDNDKVEGILNYYDRESPEDITKATNLLSSAKENYYQLNYIEAKSLALGAIENLEKGSIYDSGATLLDAYVTLGIILKSMGNTAEARFAFDKAIRLDPSFRLDSRAFSPSFVNLFEGAREELRRGPSGRIKIQTKPAAVEVYLNGVIKGVTPLVIEDIPGGEYYLKLATNKYGPVRKKVAVSGGKTAKIMEKLAWEGGDSSAPSGKNYVSSTDAMGQTEDGLKIADILRVDKVVMIDNDLSNGSAGLITARVIDAKYRAGQKPVVVSYSGGVTDGVIGELEDRLAPEVYADISSNPEKYLDPAGSGGHELMAKKKRSRVSKSLLFGIIGGILAAGLGGGLAAAFSGSSGGGGGAGNINVNFR